MAWSRASPMASFLFERANDKECGDVRRASFEHPSFIYPSCPSILRQAGLAKIFDSLREIYQKHSHTWTNNMKEYWFWNLAFIRNPAECPDITKTVLYERFPTLAFNWADVVLLDALYPEEIHSNDEHRTIVLRKYPGANFDTYDFSHDYLKKSTRKPASTRTATISCQRSQDQGTDVTTGRQRGESTATPITMPQASKTVDLTSSSQEKSPEPEPATKPKPSLIVTLEVPSKRKRQAPPNEDDRATKLVKAKESEQGASGYPTTGEPRSGPPVAEEVPADVPNVPPRQTAQESQSSAEGNNVQNGAEIEGARENNAQNDTPQNDTPHNGKE
jgi:hypothetical protein